MFKNKNLREKINFNVDHNERANLYRNSKNPKLQKRKILESPLKNGHTSQKGTNMNINGLVSPMQFQSSVQG